jgi:Fur family ferric uptake transcriptional regulator
MTYNTEKRSEITAFLKAAPNRAFTVDEIAAAVCPDGSARSTVYRIVSKMVGEGKLRKITDEHSRHTTYQYLGESGCCEHLHLKCKDCGRLIHLDEETSHLLEEKIMANGHFAIDEGAMLFGRCEGCINGKEEAKI